MRNKLIPLLIIPAFLTGCNLSKWEDISQARALEIINNIGTYYSKHQPRHLISYTLKLETTTNLETGVSEIGPINVGFHQYDIDKQVDSAITVTRDGDSYRFTLNFVLVSDSSLYSVSIDNNFSEINVNVPLFNSNQDTIKKYFQEQLFNQGISPCRYFVNLIDSLNKVNLYHELSSSYSQINGTSSLSSKNNQSLKADTIYYSSTNIKTLDIKPNYSEYTLTFDNNRCLGYTSTITTINYEELNTVSTDCVFDYDTPVGLITTNYFLQKPTTNVIKMINDNLINLFKI